MCSFYLSISYHNFYLSFVFLQSKDMGSLSPLRSVQKKKLEAEERARTISNGTVFVFFISFINLIFSLWMMPFSASYVNLVANTYRSMCTLAIIFEKFEINFAVFCF